MKRITMAAALHQQRTESSWLCRAVRSSDAEDLAILLYAAFRGTADDEGETFADAQREIEKTFSGEYGRLLLETSFVIEQEGVLASACLISWYEPAQSPFVVFTMTRPESKRQGMARFLLKRSINALIEQQYDRLTLIVTDGNKPARHLYDALGFSPVSS
jgi:GNAT superfamily N-acetyltransferase